MSKYTYAKANALINEPIYGDGNCALMVQHYAGLPHHSKWRQGAHVVEQTYIPPGTPIATFRDGIYPNDEHGNHVAFFLTFGKRTADGKTWASYWIVEQYRPSGPYPGSGRIKAREIKAKGKVAPKFGDRWADPSNNADAFYIIE